MATHAKLIQDKGSCAFGVDRPSQPICELVCRSYTWMKPLGMPTLFTLRAEGLDRNRNWRTELDGCPGKGASAEAGQRATEHQEL